MIETLIDWIPNRYPLKWANDADEVPAWDVSVNSRSAAYSFQGFAYQDEADAIELWDYEGDRKTDFEQGKVGLGDGVEIDTPPYPRLVARAPLPLAPGKPPEQFLTQTLGIASAYELKSADAFRAKVLEIASSHALMRPWRGDTLGEWEYHAKRSRFTLELTKVLSLKQGEADYRAVMLEAQGNVPPHAALDADSLYAGFLPEIRDYGTADELLSDLAARQWQRLKELEDDITGFRNKRVGITGGSVAWLEYEAALIYQNAHELRRCTGCCTPFFPARTNQKVCDTDTWRCRMRAQRTPCTLT